MAPMPSATTPDLRKSATCEAPASGQTGSDGVTLDQFVTGVTRLRAILADMVPHLPDTVECDHARDLLAEAIPLVMVLEEGLRPVDEEDAPRRRIRSGR